jgi:DNA-binding transcriptional MerR regulator
LERTPGFTVRTVVTQTISQTAAEAGVSPDTLRYYERLGLLDAPERTASGYRVYEAGTGGRVRFIKGAQRTGLRLADIKDLLDIRDRGPAPAATPAAWWSSASVRSTPSCADSGSSAASSPPCWPASKTAPSPPRASGGARPSSGRAAVDFGVFGVPETLIVDERGVVMAVLVAAVGPDTLEGVLASVRRGEPVSQGNDKYQWAG